ncbi:MAG: RagB/SusD family nutrient uptake outer membrane protein, partial [Tannerella sp.]|nr:RagB/SusD family nutrient uptake outer membrane protein [Tannerella sp.]
MKKYSNLLTTMAIVAAGCLTGCNDNEFLKEKPETSFSYAGAFSVSSQVNDCLTNVYYEHKQRLLNAGFATYGLGTDILDHRNEMGMASQLTIMSNWNTNSRLTQWNQWYGLIAMTNLVLLGVEQVEWANAADKQTVIAEARFLRGYFYLNLGELWGGVPIIDVFSESPRTDCVRATRKDTYLFALADLEAAAAVLPDHQKPGRVGKGAAWHFIAEAYLALAVDQNDAAYIDKSIAAASEVMKYHSLMKTRFGTRANPSSSGSYQGIPDYFPDGDVYFDLFQRGNLDYEEGNTESLWVDQ